MKIVVEIAMSFYTGQFFMVSFVKNLFKIDVTSINLHPRQKHTKDFKIAALKERLASKLNKKTLPENFLQTDFMSIAKIILNRKRLKLSFLNVLIGRHFACLRNFIGEKASKHIKAFKKG
jgi:hypothetical protein